MADPAVFSELQTLRITHSRLGQMAFNAENQYQDMIAHLHAAEQKGKEVEAKRKELERDLQSKQRDLDSKSLLEKETTEKLDKLKSDNEESRRRHLEAERLLSQTKIELRRVQKELSEKNKDVQQLREEVNRERNLVSSMQADTDQFNELNKQLEEDKRRLQSQLATSEGRIAERDNRIVDLNRKQIEIDQLKKDNAKLELDAQNLIDSNTILVRQLADTEGKLRKQGERNQSLLMSQTKANADVSRATVKINELEKKLNQETSRHTTELNGMKVEVERRDKNIERLRSKVTELETDSNKLRQQITSLKKRRAEPAAAPSNQQSRDTSADVVKMLQQRAEAPTLPSRCQDSEKVRRLISEIDRLRSTLIEEKKQKELLSVELATLRDEYGRKLQAIKDELDVLKKDLRNNLKPELNQCFRFAQDFLKTNDDEKCTLEKSLKELRMERTGWKLSNDYIEAFYEDKAALDRMLKDQTSKMEQPSSSHSQQLPGVCRCATPDTTAEGSFVAVANDESTTVNDSTMSEANDTNDEVASLRAQLVESRQRCDKLQTELNEYQKHRDRFQTDLAERQRLLEKLDTTEKQLQWHSTRYDPLKTEHEKVLAECQQLRTTVSELQTSDATLRKNNEELETTRRHAEDNLRLQMDRLKQENVQLKLDLESTTKPGQREAGVNVEALRLHRDLLLRHREHETKLKQLQQQVAQLLIRNSK